MQVKNSTHRIKASNDQLKEMVDYYQGYLTNSNSNYTIARAKLANVTITFYRTNVVLFQGNGEEAEYNIWAKKFNLPIEQELHIANIDYSNLTIIGSDEVGTGDYFGPIVVCATYTSKENITRLRHLGVKDSKLLTDNQIIPLALQIAKFIPYTLIYLEPQKLNNLKDSEDNFNFIKAYLHNKAINSILKKIIGVKYDAILIDEFTPKEKYLSYLKNRPDVIENFEMVVRGEKAHIGIAAASILARAAFLREMMRMSNEYGMDLLKGAGREVDRVAISFVSSFGFEELRKVAKIKFANTKRLLEYFENHPLPKSRLEGIEKITM